MRPLLSPVLLLLAACSAACSGASGSSSTVGTFPMTVASDSGALDIALASSLGQPIVGTNTVELTVTKAAGGEPMDGLTISILPWMPAMDHGTATPTVTAEGGGKYRVTDLYFFMAGTWVLKTTLSGPVSDHVEPTFEIH